MSGKFDLPVPRVLLSLAQSFTLRHVSVRLSFFVACANVELVVVLRPVSGAVVISE